MLKRGWMRAKHWGVLLFLSTPAFSASTLLPVDIPPGVMVFFAGSAPLTSTTWTGYEWNTQSRRFDLAARGVLPPGTQGLKQAKRFGGSSPAGLLLGGSGILYFAQWNGTKVGATQVHALPTAHRYTQLREGFGAEIYALTQLGEVDVVFPDGKWAPLLTRQTLSSVGLKDRVTQFQPIAQDSFAGVCGNTFFRLHRNSGATPPQWKVEFFPFSKIAILDMRTQSFTHLQSVEQAVFGQTLAYVIATPKTAGNHLPNLYSINLRSLDVLGEEEGRPLDQPLLLGIRDTMEDLVQLHSNDLRQMQLNLGRRRQTDGFAFPTKLRGLGILRLPPVLNLHQQLIWDWPMQLMGMSPRAERNTTPSTSQPPVDPQPEPTPERDPEPENTFEALLQKDLSQLPAELTLRQFVRFISGYPQPANILRSLGPTRELFTLLTETELFQLGLYRYALTYEVVDGKETASLHVGNLTPWLGRALLRKREKDACSKALTSSSRSRPE